MYITNITLFPEFFDAPLQLSIPGRAIAGGHLRIDAVNPREFATNLHRTVDDTPYGGGAGMVMRATELAAAHDEAQNRAEQKRTTVYLSPQGAPLTQEIVEELAGQPGLILVCGRYEGVDERFITQRVDREISIGDFVLSGGEPAALLLIDAIARLLDGVVGNADSIVEESFQLGTLEHPQFTRPLEFQGQEVPEILRSGDHAKVAKWRRKASLLRTQLRRPDLWEKLSLSKADQKLLQDPRIEVDAQWVQASRTIPVPDANLTGLATPEAPSQGKGQKDPENEQGPPSSS